MTTDSGKQRPYSAEAYDFLREALEQARQSTPDGGHVSGAELLESLRRLGAERYDTLAALVFREWGVKSGGDFGNVVYDLIEQGKLQQRDEDSIEDFMGGPPYTEVFEERYFQSGGGQ